MIALYLNIFSVSSNYFVFEFLFLYFKLICYDERRSLRKQNSIEVIYLFDEDKFKYVEVMIDNNGIRDKEIREKITATNKVFYGNKKLLKSKLL